MAGFFQDGSSEERLSSFVEFASAVKFLPFVKPLEQHSKEASEVIEASPTFSAFEGSLRSLFVFLFSVNSAFPLLQ